MNQCTDNEHASPRNKVGTNEIVSTLYCQILLDWLDPARSSIVLQKYLTTWPNFKLFLEFLNFFPSKRWSFTL